jgi:hypothetical protein
VLDLSSVSLVHLLGLKQGLVMDPETYQPTRMHKSVVVFHIGSVKVEWSHDAAASLLVLVLVFQEAREKVCGSGLRGCKITLRPL